MRVLESLVYSLHNSIAVPDSVQKEVNLSAWLSEEIGNHPQLKQLAKSLLASSGVSNVEEMAYSV